MVLKHAKMKDDGKVYEPKGPGSYEIPDEKVAEYNKDFEEYENIEVTIEKNKIAFKDLERAQLTPGEMVALDPMIHMLEEAT